jgi:hypothetical protein
MAADIVPKTVYWIGENINSLMQPLDKKTGLIGVIALR